ncbi:MAG: glutathione S-transferase [Proteobacteria bacterium]|nr:glutathione S-transferase [Pseudomonadota bacterium]
MYTLFGFKGSGSAAIEAALEMAGLAYHRVDAATWAPDSALAELERVNPLKQIPTLLLPDGSVMTESAAILIHLGLSFPSAKLLPADPSARAQAIRGLVFIAANCYAAIGVIDFPERWCVDPDEAVNDRIRRGAIVRLHRNWEIFVDQFPSQGFFGGDAPNGLDLLATVVSRWSGARAHLRNARPGFVEVAERVEHHPGISQVFARHWPA